MILVSGGTGFLGAHLLQALTRSGEPVRAIRRASSSLEFVKRVFELYGESPEKQFAQVEWVEADLLDMFAMEKALKGITKIYHCAGEVSFVGKDRKSLDSINADGTAILVNLCLEKESVRLCHVSSIAAIGRTRLEESIAEDRFWKNDPNNSRYAISKYNAEREVWRGIEEGMDAVIVNPAVILGYAPWTEGSGALFQRVDKGLKFYTEGITGWVDVKDVVRAMIYLMESGIKSERYIVSCGNRSYKEIFGLIADSIGKPRPAKKAGPVLSSVAWRIEKIRTFFTGNKPVITKETARTSQLKCYYENGKLLKLIPDLYTDISRTIEETGKRFREENPSR